jgi:hypothetical protein
MATHDMNGTVAIEAGTAAGHAVNKSQLDSVLAQALNRANHTGQDTVAGLSDFTSAVNTLIAAVIDGAPGALNTLNELAAALGDDANFSTTITNLIAALDTRVDDLEAAGGGAASFKANIGDGSATTYTVTHNLNTLDVRVEVVLISTGQTVYPVVTRTGVNTVLIDFGATTPATNTRRVLISEVP